MFSMPVIADDNIQTPRMIVVTSEGEGFVNTRVPREISTRSEVSAKKNVDEGNPTSYANSLKREQIKQDGMKKTKAERAIDLCERLGRGC